MLFAKIRGYDQNDNASNEEIARFLDSDPQGVRYIEIGFHGVGVRLQSVHHNGSGGYIARCGKYFIYAVSSNNFVVTCLDDKSPFPFSYGRDAREKSQGLRILDEHVAKEIELGHIPSTKQDMLQDLQMKIAMGIQEQIAAMGLGNAREQRREENGEHQRSKFGWFEPETRELDEDQSSRQLQAELKAQKLQDELRAQKLQAELKAQQFQDELRAQQLQAEYNAKLLEAEFKARQREADFKQREVLLDAKKREADLMAMQREAEIVAKLDNHSKTPTPTQFGLARRPQPPPPSAWPEINHQAVFGVVVVIIAFMFLRGQSLEHEVQNYRYQVAKERAYSEAIEQKANSDLKSLEREWKSQYNQLSQEVSFFRGENSGLMKKEFEFKKRDEDVRKNDADLNSSSYSSSSSMPSLTSMLVIFLVVAGIYRYMKYYQVEYGYSHCGDAIMEE